MSQYSPASVAEFRKKVQDYLPKALDQLQELVRIPSVSAEGLDSPALTTSAEAIVELAQSMGLQAEIRRAPVAEGELGAPAVIVQKTGGDPKVPSVLLYAHHDVQPSGSAEDWLSPAFEPQIREGRLYGRGTTDDKAGIILHLAALQILGDQLRSNVTLFIEGEEESGSPSFRSFIQENATDLDSDIIIVADSAHIDTQTPALTTTLRGTASLRVDVKVAENGLHSGVFGGPILDAPVVLARLLARLHDDSGRVAVPGLESGPGPEYNYPVEQFRQEAKTVPGLELVGEENLAARLWTEPAINVIAVDATRTDQASNTIIPQASAIISVRLAPQQDPAKASAAVAKYLQELPSQGAEVQITQLDTGSGFQADTNSIVAQSYAEALSAAWETQSMQMGMGGSIPFVADFAEQFPGAKILITGIGEPESAIHGPNESLSLQVFENSLLAHVLFLQGLSN